VLGVNRVPGVGTNTIYCWVY